jgi:hypothetical protein
MQVDLNLTEGDEERQDFWVESSHIGRSLHSENLMGQRVNPRRVAMGGISSACHDVERGACLGMAAG